MAFSDDDETVGAVLGPPSAPTAAGMTADVFLHRANWGILRVVARESRLIGERLAFDPSALLLGCPSCGAGVSRLDVVRGLPCCVRCIPRVVALTAGRA